MDLVSILTPVYNVEQFLPRYFETVLGQTYPNLQVVLLDDGSKDNSWSVMQEYAAIDSRVEIYHQENKGVASARNELLNHIKGEYFLFVDSDDWIELDMVEFLMGKARETSSEICLCGMVKDDECLSSTWKEEIWGKEKIIKEFLSHKTINGSLCNKLLKKELVQGERFIEDIGFGEDALFFWHILQRVRNVYVSDKQFYHYRMNDCSISHQKFNEKKLSGHYVWEKISSETGLLGSDFKRIALAHWAYCDTHLLRNAVRSNFSNSDALFLLRDTIKSNWQYMLGTYNIKWIIYSWLISRILNIAKIW